MTCERGASQRHPTLPRGWDADVAQESEHETMNKPSIGTRVREIIADAKTRNPDDPESQVGWLAATVESQEWELRTLKAQLERETQMNAEQINRLKAALGWGHAQPGICPAAEPERERSMEGQL